MNSRFTSSAFCAFFSCVPIVGKGVALLFRGYWGSLAIAINSAYMQNRMHACI